MVVVVVGESKLFCGKVSTNTYTRNNPIETLFLPSEHLYFNIELMWAYIWWRSQSATRCVYQPTSNVTNGWLILTKVREKVCKVRQVLQRTGQLPY
jgi:hypothetical protein